MLQLNKQQLAAVNTEEKRVYVNAGAGTGKTTVIMERIKKLTAEKRATPKEILVLAFNVDVIEKMQSKQKNNHINIKTFHKFAASLVNKYTKHKFEYATYDKDTRVFDLILKQIKQELKISAKNTDIKEMISICRENPSNKKLYNNEMLLIYKRFIDYLHKNHIYDYPRFINRACGLLEQEYIKQNIQQRYKYIFVDESQDISEKMFKMIKLMTGYNNHLFMVGDEDQQILEWNGIKNNKVEKLYKSYPELVIYPLEISFRLPQEVAKIANNLIKHDDKRIDKMLISGNNKKGLVEIKSFHSLDEEKKWCIDKINSLINNGATKTDIAVLARQDRIINHKIKKTGVWCSTIHKAKGLEFEHVILLGVEKGIFSGKNIREERRVLFEGITRTKNSLFVTYGDHITRTFDNQDIEVCKSPFIDEFYK